MKNILEGQFFCYRIKNIVGNRFGMVAPTNQYTLLFTLFEQSPDGVTMGAYQLVVIL